MGVCAFHLEQWAEAAEYFEVLLEEEPRFKKNAYLFLGIALKKLGRWEEALATVFGVLYSWVILCSCTQNTTTLWF